MHCTTPNNIALFSPLNFPEVLSYCELNIRTGGFEVQQFLLLIYVILSELGAWGGQKTYGQYNQE